MVCFFVQFGKTNTRFQWHQIPLVLWSRAILIVFEKLMHSCIVFSKLHSKPYYYLHKQCIGVFESKTTRTCNRMSTKWVFRVFISLQDRPAQAIYQPRSRPRANAEETTGRNSGTVCLKLNPLWSCSIVKY
jgi:hypothetical protein